MPGGQPRWWGWHQLADSWVRQLVEHADIRSGDLVLDVGAGAGAITNGLLAAGARVVAVELHAGRARELRQRFASCRVRVVETDAAQLRLPAQAFRVVSNPPFAITTALLRRLLAPRSQLVRADLVVPRHVGQRWASGRGHDAARWARAFHVSVTARIPRSAFHPPPPDDAVLLTIVRVGGPSRRPPERSVPEPPVPERPVTVQQDSSRPVSRRAPQRAPRAARPGR